jgi:hypothetical protein
MALYGSYAPEDGLVCVNDLDRPGSDLVFDCFADSAADAEHKLHAAGFKFNHWIIATKTYGRPMLIASGLESV